MLVHGRDNGVTSTQAQLAKAEREAKQRKLRDQMLHQIRGTGIPMPVLEYRPISTRRWRIDLAWPSPRVALELHGGIWNRGEHVRGRGFIANREKANELQLLGWTVLEVTPEHIKSGQVLEWLARALPEIGQLKRA